MSLTPAAGLATEAPTDATLSWRLLLLTGLHLPLGLLMYGFPGVATLHAVLTFIVAACLALGGRVDRVVYAAAYIAGAEVLWRMCQAAIFWESGKYVVLLTFAIALTRQRLRWQPLPVLYLLLLLPSIAIAPYDLLSDQARQQISYNLSGPASLAISVLFLSQIRWGRRQWLNTAAALVGPLAAIVTIGVYNTVTASTLNFTLNSNLVTSASFEPNQVATILGLGAMLAFYVSVEPGRRLLFRLTMGSIALILALQSAMTFSRGGLYAAGGALIAGWWYLLRERRARVMVLLGTCVLITGVVTVLPRLDRFTQGTLVARFEMVTTTGRDVLAREDLEAFAAHPIGGLGPGGGVVSGARHEVAHTEFTRLLAEHGLLGVGALVVLVIMAFQGLRAAPDVRTKALAATFFAWSVLTMAHAAMRIVAPSLIFGLAFALPATGFRTAVVRPQRAP